MCALLLHSSPADPDDVIIAPPEQYAVNGSTYTLQCSVEGDASSLVSWIPPGSNFSERESGPYVIERAGLHHEGEYVCVVYFDGDDFYFFKAVHLSVVGM